MPSAPPLAPELQDRFDAILNRLDSDDYAVREAAQGEMLEFLQQEPAVEAALVPIRRSHPSPEVRTRAALALASLEEYRLFGPTLVSLHVEDVTVPQLFAELESATGVSCQLVPGRDWDNDAADTVSLTLENVPFWEALRRVGEVSGCYPVEHSQGPPGGMMFGENVDSLARRPSSDAGAFVVEVRRLHRSDSATIELQLDEAGELRQDSSNSHNLGIQLRVLVEPKIYLATSMSVPEIEQAVDEVGNDLLSPAMRNQGGWYGSGTRWSYDVNVSLDPRRSRDATRLARLSGVFNVEVAREMARLDVDLQDVLGDDPLQPGKVVSVDKIFDLGPYALEIESIRRDDPRSVTFEMKLRSAGGVDLQQVDDFWQRINQLLQTLRVVDESGRSWSQGGGQTNWDQREIAFERTFRQTSDEDSRPARLQWEVPVRTEHHQIPFEFEDLPLPELGL